MSLAFLHGRLGISCILYLAMAAIWGLALAIRREPVSPPYRGMLLIAEGLVVVEMLVGLAVRVSGTAPSPQPLHFLYGALVVLILPLAFGIAQGPREKRAPLIFGIALVFLTGLSIRALNTGQLH